MNLLKRPSRIDAAFLSAFAVLITLHPYYLYGELNLFELGIYLPGINALLDGQIPYRDFFHLRGPLELYIPALMMRIFGENVSVLVTYFYIGTVVALIIGILVAKELYGTRFVLYLLVPVFIGRTFPRVVFVNWGGMRYGLGLLAILCGIYYFRRQKSVWLFLAGIASALALLTSAEIGVCAFLAIPAGIMFERYAESRSVKSSRQKILVFCLGALTILLPYLGYLVITQSAGDYFNSTFAVATRMTKVFPDKFLGDHPQDLFEALAGMNPFNGHFKHLTPAYCYLFFAGYCLYGIRRKAVKKEDSAAVSLAVYGLVMFSLAFRKLGGSQFEMALQPEKILLFFMLERVLWFILARRDILRNRMKSLTGRNRTMCAWGVNAIHVLIIIFVMSSLGYAVARYNKRFFAFQYVRNLILRKDVRQLMPLAGIQQVQLQSARVNGLVVPAWQAEDFKSLAEFIDKNTDAKEVVFMFPELGSYNFIVDRPFVGRFPMATFSWIGTNWHGEFMREIKIARPRFVVMARDPGATFPDAYFKIPSNKQHYEEVARYIQEYYSPVDGTPSLLIYERESAR